MEMLQEQFEQVCRIERLAVDMKEELIPFWSAENLKKLPHHVRHSLAANLLPVMEYADYIISALADIKLREEEYATARNAQTGPPILDHSDGVSGEEGTLPGK